MALIGQAVLEEVFENGSHIHVYSPGAGADNPPGVKLFSLTQLFSQLRPCRKIGHGQPRVISHINLVEIEFSMLHAKFQDHRTSGSGEDF